MYRFWTLFFSTWHLLWCYLRWRERCFHFFFSIKHMKVPQKVFFRHLFCIFWSNNYDKKVMCPWPLISNRKTGITHILLIFFFWFLFLPKKWSSIYASELKISMTDRNDWKSHARVWLRQTYWLIDWLIMPQRRLNLEMTTIKACSCKKGQIQNNFN